MVNFTNPGILGDAAHFRRYFEVSLHLNYKFNREFLCPYSFSTTLWGLKSRYAFFIISSLNAKSISFLLGKETYIGYHYFSQYISIYLTVVSLDPTFVDTDNMW